MTDRYDHHATCHHTAYRMSCEDFDGLWEYAMGRCQICKTPEAETVRRKLVIDHAPDYGPIAVRGLLCDKCNNLMGKFDARKTNDRRCYSYRNRAWFVRALLGRRVNTFPDHVRARYAHQGLVT